MPTERLFLNNLCSSKVSTKNILQMMSINLDVINRHKHADNNNTNSGNYNV